MIYIEIIYNNGVRERFARGDYHETMLAFERYERRARRGKLRVARLMGSNRVIIQVKPEPKPWWLVW